MALILICKKNTPIDVFNIATGKETSLNEILTIFGNLSNSKIEVNYCEPRKGDIKNSVASIEKISELGFKPEFTVEEGLDRYWKGLLD